jgi:RNA-directed DNA polymerase
MSRVRARAGDKRVLALVKAFLKAGILSEDGLLRDNDTGTRQGSILSPLLSNVALPVLDEHIAQAPREAPEPMPTSAAGAAAEVLPTCRLVRYADDWCLLVHGTQADAKALRDQTTGVLSAMGLRLSPEKTLITHIEQGLDFLGWRIQRRRKPGTNRYYIYTCPAKKAPRAIMAKAKTLCRQAGTNQPPDALLTRLNPALRGWCACFRPGASAATFSYLRHYLWHTVWRWVQRKHPKTGRRKIRRHYAGRGSWWASENRELFNPNTVGTTRYRYRGTAIPTPWTTTG